MCFYRGHHEEFKDLFSQEHGVVFCNDVCSVMEVLGHEYNTDQRLCGDLKVVTLLLGMQHSYTKYCCFLCEWVRRDKKNHYVNKQ